MGTEQKVAVITGASQGIGAGLVKAFRDRNYRVVANSRSIEPASDEDILTAAGDIADPATAKRVIGEGLERFGRIDTLVNNAGIFIAKRFTSYPKRSSPRSSQPTWPASSTSRSGPSRRWSGRAAVTSSTSRRAW